MSAFRSFSETHLELDLWGISQVLETDDVAQGHVQFLDKNSRIGSELCANVSTRCNCDAFFGHKSGRLVGLLHANGIKLLNDRLVPEG